MNILANLGKKNTLFWILTGCLFIAGIGAADLITGSELAFSLFYLMPIVLVTWFSSRNLGLMMSLVGMITWFSVDILAGQSYSEPIIRYWNAAIRLGFFVIVTLLLSALKTLEREREMARTDYLTGVANRRHFFETLENELDRSQRYNHSFTIAYIDMDNFKSVNDRAGHKTGDKVLCAFVDRVRSQLRKTDIIARLGGDEFILLLPETGDDTAQVIIPKLQTAVLDEMHQKNWPVTFSIGVLVYQAGSITADKLVNHADDLMYSVKKNGKNGVAYKVYAG